MVNTLQTITMIWPSCTVNLVDSVQCCEPCATYVPRDISALSMGSLSSLPVYPPALPLIRLQRHPKQLPGEARVSLSDDELCLFRLLRFSRTPRGDDELPAKHGNNSASSPEPSVSSSVKTLSQESEIRTATPGFAASPKPNLPLSNNTFGEPVELKLHSEVGTAVAPVSSVGSLVSVSVGSHSDIIFAQFLIHAVNCILNYIEFPLSCDPSISHDLPYFNVYTNPKQIIRKQLLSLTDMST